MLGLMNVVLRKYSKLSKRVNVPTTYMYGGLNNFEFLLTSIVLMNHEAHLKKQY